VAQQSDWYILEINEHGESATYPELVAAIQEVFGVDAEYFIPIYHEQLGSYISTNTLFEGYVFVKDSDTVRSNLINVRDSQIFSGLLKMCGKIQMLGSKEINNLRRKLKNSLNKKFQQGVKVKVHEGVFQNLEGEVLSIEDNGRIANVRIVCLSREIIAPIPTTCLEELS
jgi:transcription antitermination factor NusG